MTHNFSGFVEFSIGAIFLLALAGGTWADDFQSLLKYKFPTITWPWFFKFLLLGLSASAFLGGSIAGKPTGEIRVDDEGNNFEVRAMDWQVFERSLFWYFLFAAPAYFIGRQLQIKDSMQKGYRQALAEWPELSQERRDYVLSLMGEIRATNDWSKLAELKRRVDAEHPSMIREMLKDMLKEQQDVLHE